jgi:predicted PurR-regulated permease PerM
VAGADDIPEPRPAAVGRSAAAVAATNAANGAASGPVRVEVPWRHVLLLGSVAGVVLLAAAMLRRLEHVLAIAVAAGAYACLTARVRAALGRWTGDAVAAVVVAVLTIAGIAAASAVLASELGGQLDAVAAVLVAEVESLDPGSVAGRIAESTAAASSIERFAAEAPVVAVNGEPGPLGIGRRASELLLVVVLGTFLQSGARDAVDWFVRRWDRKDRAAVRSRIADLDRSGVGSVRRSLLLGAAAGSLVAAATIALDLRSPLALGLWTGVWALVPVVGWPVGLAPFVAIAGLDGWAEGSIALAVSVVVVVGARWARERWISAPLLRLGPGVSVLCVAAGFLVGGLSGIVALLLTAAVAAVALRHGSVLIPPRRPGPSIVGRLRLEGSPGSERVEDGRAAPAPPPGSPVVVARLSWRTILRGSSAVLLVVAASMALHRAGPFVVWAVVGALLAVVADRPVSWIDRRARTGRIGAVAVICVAGALVVCGAGLLTAAGLDGVGESIVEDLPGVVEDAETLPLVGPALEERDVSGWVDERIDTLPQDVAGNGSVARALPTAGTAVVGLFWVAIIAVALAVDGPRLVANARSQVPARSRRQAVRTASIVHRALAGYATGAATVATLNGLVVTVTAFALGIPLAPVLGLWAFLWNFVPQIGGFMGGAALVALAFTVGPAQALIAATLFVAYQFTENHLIQPRLISQAIDVPPWAVLLAALAGGAAAGVVGAIVLTPLVGAVKAVAEEVREPDFPTATMEPAPRPAAAMVPS